MTDEELEAKIKAMSFSSGKNDMTLEDMATIQPGLARIMPEIGARTWKLFYAAKAGNWENAIWQWKETKGLFELAGFVRPKHEDALKAWTSEASKWEDKPGETQKSMDDFQKSLDKSVEESKKKQ